MPLKLAPKMALLTLGLASLISVSHAARAQTAQVSQKPVLTTLHRFDGKYGASPYDTLTVGPDGNFYGVTFDGGLGDGTVFKMVPSGQFTTLIRFNGNNGGRPVNTVAVGADGNLYGTAAIGGRYSRGTVFRVTPQGDFKTVHDFSATEGGTPYAALLPAPDGTFYGTTVSGSTVFHMTAEGHVTVLHFFTEADGGTIQGSLVFGADGALYGTAAGGGRHSEGTVFRITPSGAFSVLHSFTADGHTPYGGLTAGKDGSFYGVTYAGGIDDAGEIYKITASGVFTTIHKFSEDGHGASPYSALTLGADGNFYGTTPYGGIDDRGTVFVMTPAGQLTTLYKFHTSSDGQHPYGGVAFGPDGDLYGTTQTSGAKSNGTIYKLTLPQ